MSIYLLYDLDVVYGGPGERFERTLVGYAVTKSTAKEWVRQNTKHDYVGGREYQGPVDQIGVRMPK